MQAIWRLDYCGIVILIMASLCPGVYYGFMCNYLVRNLYLPITCVLGAPRLYLWLDQSHARPSSVGKLAVLMELQCCYAPTR